MAGVDYQHAVLEFMEQDDCFVLQDLNSAQGTYVNDTRVQNAAVRLAPGDSIRFGYNGTPYELHLENKPQVSSLVRYRYSEAQWYWPRWCSGYVIGNGLVCTGFAFRYRLQTRAGF